MVVATSGQSLLAASGQILVAAHIQADIHADRVARVDHVPSIDTAKALEAIHNREPHQPLNLALRRLRK